MKGVTLHVDFLEKTITNATGEVAKGKVYFAGYLEIQFEDTHLKLGVDADLNETVIGEWPEDLIEEIGKVTVKLSRHGNNSNCEMPVTHLALHNGHACTFNCSQDMQVYMSRVEGDLATAEERVVKLIEQYYETESSYTLHSKSQAEETNEGIIQTPEDAQEFLDNPNSDIGVTVITFDEDGNPTSKNLPFFGAPDSDSEKEEE